MPKLTDLTTGIEGRLNAVFNAGNLWTPNQAALAKISVLVQDAKDVENEIDEAVEQIGMLCLVNMPSFQNQEKQNTDIINGRIHLIVEVGEQPVVWRDDPLTVPTAMDVAEIVARALNGFFISGFQKLHVVSGNFQRDKKRQVFSVEVETLRLFDPISV
ncbi:MAG TPA: hypothetical protein VHY30_01565 [Verrucomicrobiae bacterium]|jgi:hypothetical protein|nr:hypothetical protein [Verrucomicrobiae bacterium]